MNVVLWVVQISDFVVNERAVMWEIDEVFFSRADARERAKKRRKECYVTRIVKCVEENK